MRTVNVIKKGADMLKHFESNTEKQVSKSPPSPATVIFLTLAFMVSSTCFLLALTNLLDLHHFPSSENWKITVFRYVFGYGSSALLCLSWVRFIEKRDADSIGLKSNGLKNYVKGMLLSAFFAFIVIDTLYLLGGVSIDRLTLLQDITLDGFYPLFLLLIGFAIKGATVEIFIRGWLFGALAARHGRLIGIIGNTLFSSALCIGQITKSSASIIALGNIALFGLFLSLYAEREGNIWGACAWHSVWNFLLGAGVGIEVSGSSLLELPFSFSVSASELAPIWLSGGELGPKASLVTSIVLILAIFLVSSWRRQNRTHHKYE